MLSEFPRGSERDAVAAGLTPTVYTADAALAARRGGARRRTSVGVHLKVDTGMHRVGAVAAGGRAGARARGASTSGLRLEGLWTHFASAEVDDEGTREQLRRLLAARDALGPRRRLRPELLHAANSAGTIRFPEAHLDLVRPGAAMYGIDPGLGIGPAFGLRPALDVALRGHDGQARPRRRAALVRVALYARSATLGRHGPRRVRGRLQPRRSRRRADVLIRGRRRRVAGTVTMDQLLVDCGDDEVTAGDEVVLIGAQGSERITADELAAHAGTIGYEIATSIGARVPRRYVG